MVLQMYTVCLMIFSGGRAILIQEKERIASNEAGRAFPETKRTDGPVPEAADGEEKPAKDRHSVERRRLRHQPLHLLLSLQGHLRSSEVDVSGGGAVTDPEE